MIDLGDATPGDVLVDTNLLLVLLVGAVNPTHIAAFKRTRGAYTSSDFDLLNAFLGSARRVVVTPHVMTEVSNLAGQLQEHIRPAAFAVLAQLTSTFDERAEPSAAVVAEPLFLRLGLTDAAIARAAHGQLAVLTDDQALYRALAYAGVRVYNFAHVRAASA